MLRIFYLLDPFGIYAYIPGILSGLSFWLGISTTITSSALGVSIWFDIAHDSLKENSGFIVAKVVTVCVGVFQFGCVCVILFINEISENDGTGSTLLNIVIIVAQLAVIAVAVIVLPQVKKLFADIKGRHRKKLDKVYLVVYD